MAKIKILGGGGEVGRAAYLVSDLGQNILLDYGVNFDENDRPQFPGHVRPVDLTGVVITHAHLDHIGAAPLLYITGHPPIVMTKPTLDIGRLLIRDFLKINAFYIDYDLEEVENMSTKTIAVEYGQEIELGGFRVLLTSAGHILGSSMVYLETPSGHRILYTGDINTIQTWTLSKVELWPIKIDTLIIESTYGSTKHPPRHETEHRLASAIEEVLDSGGAVLIPAFSVGRTQEVMCLVHAEVPGADIYIDGMSREITSIYLRHKTYLRDPGLFEKVVEHVRFVRGWQERRKIWRRPAVIISSAGMLKGGPSIYYLKKIGDNPSNAIYLVSYQAVDSPGHKLLETGGIDEFGIDRVNARVEWFDLSSHAGKDGLLDVVKRYKNVVQNIIIVHGEPDSSSNLERIIREEIGEDISVFRPLNGDEIVLE